MINQVFNKTTWGVEITPERFVNTSIIWMHGLGASCEDFVPITEQFCFTKDNNVRFLFPNAPIRSVTINNGLKMRAWYDVKNVEEFLNSTHHSHHDEQCEGLEHSKGIIETLVQQEMTKGVSSKRIILAGFSQGGAMALYSGLRFTKPLGGIICLSGYLPKHNAFVRERSDANQGTPIFMAHGLFDPIVSIHLASHSCDTLLNLNYNVLWKTYPMQHMVTAQEIIDINSFLNKVLLS